MWHGSSPSNIDQGFAARMAVAAAETFCDGDEYGTWDGPDAVLKPAESVERCLNRAGYRVYGGPGLFNLFPSRARRCFRMIRWAVSDEPDELVLNGATSLTTTLADTALLLQKDNESKDRWERLDVEATIYMLLLSGEYLKQHSQFDKQRRRARKQEKQKTLPS
jgi:hypothetical protein